MILECNNKSHVLVKLTKKCLSAKKLNYSDLVFIFFFLHFSVFFIVNPKFLFIYVSNFVHFCILKKKFINK